MSTYRISSSLARVRSSGVTVSAVSPWAGLMHRGRGTQGRAGYCEHCGMSMPDGPDACLGWLPNVSHACCGHGDEESAYIVIGGEPDQHYRDIPKPVSLYGKQALDWMRAE